MRLLLLGITGCICVSGNDVLKAPMPYRLCLPENNRITHHKIILFLLKTQCQYFDGGSVINKLLGRCLLKQRRIMPLPEIEKNKRQLTQAYPLEAIW